MLLRNQIFLLKSHHGLQNRCSTAELIRLTNKISTLVFRRRNFAPKLLRRRPGHEVSHLGRFSKRGLVLLDDANVARASQSGAWSSYLAARMGCEVDNV